MGNLKLKRKQKKTETKEAGINLPITEMTDDWMDDDIAIGSIDSDEDENESKTNTVNELQGPLSKEAKVQEPEVEEEAKKTETKVAGINLPITEMTDDWMDDDIAI